MAITTINVITLPAAVADDLGSFALYALATEAGSPIWTTGPSRMGHSDAIRLPRLDSHGTDRDARRAELAGMAESPRLTAEARAFVAGILTPAPTSYSDLMASAAAICSAAHGYGTPKYRGDPVEAVAMRQAAERLIDEQARRIVGENVRYCVSSLVHGLSRTASGMSADTLATLNIDYDDLISLANRAPDADDYREAAAYSNSPDVKAIVVEQRGDAWRWRSSEYHAAFDWSDGNDTAVQAWREAFAELGEDDPDGSEVFEHWLVSDWLADALEARGESVARDVAGLTVWGRTTTGQMICMDAVIRNIAKELEA